jgi:hypothetical protein
MVLGTFSSLFNNFLDFNFRLFILILLYLLLLLLEVLDKTYLLPNGKFTIPAIWVNAAKDKSSYLWGLTLGLGFITYSSGALWHAYLITLVLFGDWEIGIFTGVLYALGRTLLPSFKKIRKSILLLQQSTKGNSTYLKIYRRIYSYIVFAIVVIFSVSLLR